MDTEEGEKDLCRLLRQKDRAAKVVQEVPEVLVLKDRDGNVLTSEEFMLRGWIEKFEERMNEENDRKEEWRRWTLEQEVGKINEDEE